MELIISLLNNIVGLILLVLGLTSYIIWVVSQDDYFYKHAVMFALLAILNIVI